MQLVLAGCAATPGCAYRAVLAAGRLVVVSGFPSVPRLRSVRVPALGVGPSRDPHDSRYRAHFFCGGEGGDGRSTSESNGEDATARHARYSVTGISIQLQASAVDGRISAGSYPGISADVAVEIDKMMARQVDAVFTGTSSPEKRTWNRQIAYAGSSH